MQDFSADFDEDDDDTTFEITNSDFFSYSAEEMAHHWIDQFFKNQNLYCGGPIPKTTLHSADNVKMVIETDLDHGIPKMYDLIGENVGDEDLESDEEFSTDVKMVLSYLAQCRNVGVPKEFISGLVLMHLELCRGMKSDDDFNQFVAYE